MSAARGGRGTPGRGEAGALMMFVLMAILLVGAVTLSVMQILTADVTGGVEQLEADQVFNIAQAGVHYAIGKLQTSGATVYAGETTAITDGSGTTLGTATITVNCIDTGAAPPCGGAYAGYRRIISTGSLPVAGPTRKIVAIVQATGGGGSYALCGLQSVDLQSPSDLTTFYGDIGSNGTISISTTQNPPGVFVIAADPNTPPQFQGVAKAVGTITCASGCASQVQGGVFPGQSGPVCSPPPSPTYVDTSGFSDLPVAAGTTYTMNPGQGYNWKNINLANGTCSGGTPFTTLQIVAPGGPGTTTVVQANTLVMGGCTRLMVTGAGNIELRIGAATGTALYVGGTNNTPVHFGVGPSDQYSTPAPLPAGQLTVWVNSSNMSCSGGSGAPPPPSCAGMISNAWAGSATIYAPNGSFNYDDSGGSGQAFNGPLVANKILMTSWNFFNLGAGTSSTVGTFNKLLSWKDQ